METTKNEIKKALYREKPSAFFNYIEKGIAHYHAELGDSNLWFKIPVNDMGDSVFGTVMQAQLLIRWME